MIKRIYEPEKIKERLGIDVYSLKIKSLLFCYGTVYDFCVFYIQNGNIFAGYYNEYIFTCKPNDEAEEFLQAVGAAAVFAPGMHDNTVIMAANGNSSEHLNTVKHYNFKINTAPESGIVYRIFKEAFKDFSDDFDGWYVDISHRARHGQCRLYTVECENGGAAMGALSLGFIFPEAVFISAVGVLRQRSGFGSALISAVLKQYSDRKVYAVCSKKNVGFYERSGFCTVDAEI